MLRLSRMADYSIVVMTYLARADSGEWITATTLAEDSELPQPTVTKVLKVLQAGGLLHSRRGVSGGYKLVRTPAEISIAEIVEAIEGPIRLTDCCASLRPVEETGTPRECDIACSCPVTDNWQKLNQAVHRALDGLSLEVMSAPFRKEQLVRLR